MRLSRRTVLAASALAGVAGCTRARPDAPPSTQGSSPTPSPSATPRSDSSLEVWLDESRQPTTWWQQVEVLAATELRGRAIDEHGTARLAADLAERFTAKAAPDLVVNGGPDLLGIAQLAPSLADLTPALSARTPDGKVLGQVLRPGAVEHGRVAGRQVSLPLVQAVDGLWFSAPLFADHVWRAPTTWDDLMALGEAAAKQEMHLFAWGRETATTYLRLALSSAVKQGGDGVRRALDGLEPHAWSQPEVQAALKAMHAAVKAGHVKPGGSQRAWRKALDAWAKDRTVLMVSGGAWLARETPTSFGATLVPDPSIGSGAALPASAVHAGPAGHVMAPLRTGAGGATDRSSHAPGTQAPGTALLPLVFDRSTATAFSQATQLLTTRADALPTTRGPLLQRQLAVLEAAGSHTYSWRFLEHHALVHDHQALWNAFLEGQLDVATLTRESQRTSDLIAADPTHLRYPVR